MDIGLKFGIILIRVRNGPIIVPAHVKGTVPFLDLVKKAQHDLEHFGKISFLIRMNNSAKLHGGIREKLIGNS